MYKQTLNFLNSRKAYNLLLLANLLAGLAVFIVFRNLVSGDQGHYLRYAEGLMHGRYSFWWNLPNYVPDTLRNPGYPIFIYLIKSIYSSTFFVKIIQFILYSISVGLVLKIANKFESGFLLKNIFLIALLPSLQIVTLTVAIQPEALMIFLITSWVYLDYSMNDSWKKVIVLGILAGIIFQVRPVFLFYPFLKILIEIIFYKKINFVKNGVMLLIYFSTMIPYGLWNLKHHKVFSITSIESGGGVLQLGYWSFLLPGYWEDRYWKNIMAVEPISFCDSTEVNKNIKAYNEEWDYIDSSCAHLLTKQDTINLELMKSNINMFKIYNSKYTLERERILKKITFQNYISHPIYTIKTKFYSFFRIWITNYKTQSTAIKTDTARKGIFFSSIVSAIILLASIIIIPLALKNYKTDKKIISIVLPMLLYFGIIHLPFAIQVRYTIPVRLLLFFLLAYCLYTIISRKGKKV